MTAITRPPATAALTDPLRLAASYLAFELRRAVRNRRYVMFTMTFPVIFYLLYTGLLQ